VPLFFPFSFHLDFKDLETGDLLKQAESIREDYRTFRGSDLEFMPPEGAVDRIAAADEPALAPSFFFPFSPPPKYQRT